MPSFITMWVKAWKRESSPRPARTLQPLRDLLASWVGVLAERLSWWCHGASGVCRAIGFFSKTVNLCENNSQIIRHV